MNVPGARDVAVGPRVLPGRLMVPKDARGLVIFAHGSGSSRHSPRNVYAAERLDRHDFATLLFDLLTSAESAHRQNVFDIPLLATRVIEAIDWARNEPNMDKMPIGLFGASTGAGAAIVAAAERPRDVGAVVSRGGRPDLAGYELTRITAPTLLLVGENDREVISLNRSAQAMMSCETELVIVPRAGHLFDEPGTLDYALDAAIAWFEKHLGRDVGGTSAI